MTLTSWTTWVTRACEKSRASASCDSQLTDASATGVTSKILRGRMFMGAFIVCALAFVKSFLRAFWGLFQRARDDAESPPGPANTEARSVQRMEPDPLQVLLSRNRIDQRKALIRECFGCLLSLPAPDGCLIWLDLV